MLGFRSLFRTYDTPDLLDIASGQLYLWLKRKRLNADALVEGSELEIGEGTRASLQRATDEIGSMSMRARVVETRAEGSWVSELTVLNSPTGNRGWVWLDIHKPDDHGWTATPNLARTLVSALPVRDGRHILTSRPKVVRFDDVPQVIDSLTDPGRRGLAFVAGTGHSMRLPDWRETVEDILGDTTGLANAWVLAQDATDRFNHMVGRSHGVKDGSVRTFVPGVKVHDPLDGERHRFLTTTGISRASSHSTRRILGQSARAQMIAAKLPTALREVDRLLRHGLDEALLDGFAESQQAPTESPTEAKETSQKPDNRDQDAVLGTVLDESVEAPIDQVTRSQLSKLLAELVGTPELSIDGLSQLGSLARAHKRAEATRDRVRVRLRNLEDEIEAEKLEREILQEELDSLQIEHISSEEERVETQRHLRHLRIELSRSGQASVAWVEPELDIRDIRPDSFVELVERIADLDRIIFTGDAAVTEDLDRHGSRRSWAGKTWEALLALENYARLRVQEAFGRDVGGYLSDTPAGCRSFSSNRHAVNESESVQQNPRCRGPRELRVPGEVSPSGKIFMGAHFKIAQSATISPRLHYHDDTSKGGQVYIGYIGRHLPI